MTETPESKFQVPVIAKDPPALRPLDSISIFANMALKPGGADKASNMQWQTREAAKAKDLVE